MLETDRIALVEALFSINRIFDFLDGISNKESFVNDDKTHDAVLLQFIVLGESCKRISSAFKAQHPHIDWRGANDFRNFIAHDYFGVSDDVVWSVIRFHLPQLKADFQALLENHSG